MLGCGYSQLLFQSIAVKESPTGGAKGYSSQEDYSLSGFLEDSIENGANVPPHAILTVIRVWNVPARNPRDGFKCIVE